MTIETGDLDRERDKEGKAVIVQSIAKKMKKKKSGKEEERRVVCDVSRCATYYANRTCLSNNIVVLSTSIHVAHVSVCKGMPIISVFLSFSFSSTPSADTFSDFI